MYVSCFGIRLFNSRYPDDTYIVIQVHVGHSSQVFGNPLTYITCASLVLHVFRLYVFTDATKLERKIETAILSWSL